jgi:hypothetical protein
LTDKPISNRAFSLWTLVIGLEGILAVYFMAREPSEAENALAFGLSSQRLLIVLGALIVSILFIVVAGAHISGLLTWNKIINRKPGLIRYWLASAFVLEIIVIQFLFLVPEYYFPVFSEYLLRLKPIFAWLFLILAQTIISLFYLKGLEPVNTKRWRSFMPIMIALVTIMFAWGTIAITDLGIAPDELFWNEAGVPILAGQAWVAIGITFVGWFLYERFQLSTKFVPISFLLIFIGIWIVAALVWVKTPLTPSFNAPGPYLPSKDYYPFVDAALYDLGAQSAVYGKGIFWGLFIDRGFLFGFLAILHRFFGQNYLTVVNAQAAMFAIFPALLYLLGKKLHSVSVGVMAAVLATLEVSNAITAGKFIGTSHPKLMLTEFPTGIALVLVSLFLASWLTENKTRVYSLIGVGASIGIGILLRQNVLFMFPAMFVLGLTVWKLRWKLALRDIVLVLAAFFITISPWMWRNQRVAGEPFFFLPHFQSVIEERYQSQIFPDQAKRASNLPSRALSSHPTTARMLHNNTVDLSQYQFIPKHFVHNIVTSVMILPPSPVLDDLRHTLDDFPYWGRMADRSFADISSSTSVFLAINLIVLSIGIGAAWKRVKFAALVPAIVFLFYNLANAFARTSGGRYIVPVDWVIYFYYAIGLIEIIQLCIKAIGFHANNFFETLPSFEKEQGNKKLNWGRAGLVILPFFLIVAALPIIDLTSPGARPAETTDSLLQQLDADSFFERSGVSKPEMEEFLKTPGATLISGRGFYPRYYSYNEGEPILPGQLTPYTPRDFPRLVFTLLLPNGDRSVLLPIDEPRLNFPDAAKVIVGGCQVGQSQNQNTILTSYLNFIDAAFVVILDEPTHVYVRVPNAPLTCPLRTPICDNNHNCH